MKNLVNASALLALCAGVASARPLVDTRVDTPPGNTIGSYSYTGAGTGFGGTVGNGSISLDSDATNLYIRFNAAGNYDNLVTIMFNTRAGGFTDAQVALNLSASTLSTHLASLERKIGGRLCERGRAGACRAQRGMASLCSL